MASHDGSLLIEGRCLIPICNISHGHANYLITHKQEMIFGIRDHGEVRL